MGDTDKEKLIYALGLDTKGQKKEAMDFLWANYKNFQEKAVKLQAILALSSSLNALDDMDKIGPLCEEGISLATELKDFGAIAFLYARKASNLLALTMVPNHRAKNLTLMPDRIGFALESEEKEFNFLTSYIRKNYVEAETLFNKSLEIINKLQYHDVKARVLLIVGEAYGNIYLQYKGDHLNLKKRFWLKLVTKFFFLRRFNIENYLLLTKKERLQLRKIVNTFRKCLMDAIGVYKALQDEVGEAYALFSLAVQFKSSNKFRKAKKYLSESEYLAKKHNIVELLTNIKEVGRSIKARNRDTPDYFAGERRVINK